MIANVKQTDTRIEISPLLSRDRDSDVNQQQTDRELIDTDQHNERGRNKHMCIWNEKNFNWKIGCIILAALATGFALGFGFYLHKKTYTKMYTIANTSKNMEFDNKNAGFPDFEYYSILPSELKQFAPIKELTDPYWQGKTLQLLTAFDKLMKKNNIPYVAYAGTALGLLRHHGLIPWDDDIDFAVHYKDLKKFNDTMS